MVINGSLLLRELLTFKDGCIVKTRTYWNDTPVAGVQRPTKPAMGNIIRLKKFGILHRRINSIRDLTRRFVRSELPPHILRWDEKKAVPCVRVNPIGELVPSRRVWRLRNWAVF